MGSPSAGVRDSGPRRHATRTDLDPGGAGHDTARQTDQCLTRRHNSKHTSGGRVGAQKGANGRGGEGNSGSKAGKTRLDKLIDVSLKIELIQHVCTSTKSRKGFKQLKVLLDES